MLESWVKECDFLAPYLKEKLEQDEEHTWESAPYIGEAMRKELRKIRPAPEFPSLCPSYLSAAPFMSPWVSGDPALLERQAGQETIAALTAYYTQQNVNAIHSASLQNQFNALQSCCSRW